MQAGRLATPEPNSTLGIKIEFAAKTVPNTRPTAAIKTNILPLELSAELVGDEDFLSKPILLGGDCLFLVKRYTHRVSFV